MPFHETTGNQTLRGLGILLLLALLPAAAAVAVLERLIDMLKGSRE